MYIYVQHLTLEKCWPQIVLVGKKGSVSLHQKGWHLRCHPFGANLHILLQ